jgi:hypothetical protein
MHIRALILLSVVVLGTSCRYRDPSVDLLESELRWMEDQVYMLEDELESKSAQLAASRVSVESSSLPTLALPTSAVHSYVAPTPDYTIMMGDEGSVDLPPLAAPRMDPPVTDAPSIDIPSAQPSTRSPVTGGAGGYSTTEPSIDLPPDDSSRTDALDSGNGNSSVPEYQIIEPAIEFPANNGGSGPTSNVPALLEPSHSTLAPPGDASPSMGSASGDNVRLQSFFNDVTPTRQSKNGSTELDAHVTHIVVQGEITTAYDFDDKPTEPGLLVVVEPRNSDGRYVSLAGPISVVVLDGNLRGSGARIARWDFDAADARRRIRKSARGRGVHLVLPWPEGAPESDALHLFVRYTTVEGRSLESDELLKKGRSSERWNATRRASKRGWLGTNPMRGVRISTSPIKALPIANPGDIQLRPIPQTARDVRTASYDTPLKRSSFSTVPLAPRNASDRESAALRTRPPVENRLEMPAVRNIQRPEWKPYR